MWSRRNSPERRSDVEAALRGHRADPPAGFVEDLARSLVPSRVSPPRAWSRLAFAAAVSVFILGTFASFGGLSYAASGATDTYKAVQKVVVKHKLAVSVKKSSAAGQYPHKPLKPPTVTPTKTSTPPATGVAAAQTNTLPFTGVSLLTTLVLSLTLIGAGIALRRRERRN